MRAMILAAGLGTRMGSLSRLVPKPALPIRGTPLVAYALAWLAHNGVSEVILNLHHLPERMRHAARSRVPRGMTLHFSEEAEPLGTGGGIRRAADFLRESDPSLVVPGDMLVDMDLATLLEAHRARRDLATLALRADPRASEFGSIGYDGEACVQRIGRTILTGTANAPDAEHGEGLFTGVRLLASRAFDCLPDRDDAFEDLREWFAPMLRAGARDVRVHAATARECTWEPVGTPHEYLVANLAPPRLSYADTRAWAPEGTRIEKERVIGAGASIGEDCELERVVVWEGETVPPGTRARDAVFGGGRVHPAGAPSSGAGG